MFTYSIPDALLQMLITVIVANARVMFTPGSFLSHSAASVFGICSLSFPGNAGKPQNRTGSWSANSTWRKPFFRQLRRLWLNEIHFSPFCNCPSDIFHRMAYSILSALKRSLLKSTEKMCIEIISFS